MSFVAARTVGSMAAGGRVVRDPGDSPLRIGGRPGPLHELLPERVFVGRELLGERFVDHHDPSGTPGVGSAEAAPAYDWDMERSE
jgi:hypothetical protein